MMTPSLSVATVGGDAPECAATNRIDGAPGSVIPLTAAPEAGRGKSRESAFELS